MEGSTVTPHPNVIRGPIEEQYNGLRDDIEKQYIQDRKDLEESYQEDLVANRAAKEAALEAAGLNRNGSVPPSYPETSEPENTVAPTISGTATEDQVLTAHPGTWSRSPTYSYQWERANANKTARVDIDGETDTTYTLTTDDVGKVVRVRVTASDAAGSDIAESAWTSTIQAAP